MNDSLAGIGIARGCADLETTTMMRAVFHTTGTLLSESGVPHTGRLAPAGPCLGNG